MEDIAHDEPPSLTTLAVFQQQGRAWVQANDRDQPVAYILVEWVDRHAHIAQVSVHPDYARQRLGRGLIEHVATWAQQHDAAGLSLTTFTEVAWNGPYYARCGFQIVAVDELGPEHRQLQSEEAARGLDRWPRACMRRALSGPA
ncbi:MAG: GNAT family N-acetyltransferase [Deltaproteobacteria bacterium]|nr:GNAT family N-acetyltransferase [Deltaproteobacteria bacterium]